MIDSGLLSKLDRGILVAVVRLLAMMEFGNDDNDAFRVDSERLGCYRHREHIDNPKGYPDDAFSFYRECLRGPVDAEEYDVDEATAMKRYFVHDFV
jgi:hypothetical protein